MKNKLLKIFAGFSIVALLVACGKDKPVTSESNEVLTKEEDLIKSLRDGSGAIILDKKQFSEIKSRLKSELTAVLGQGLTSKILPLKVNNQGFQMPLEAGAIVFNHFDNSELEQAAKNNAAKKGKLKELEEVNGVLPKDARLIALDERGDDLTTARFAERIERWMDEGRDLAFVIGGADGLDPAIKARADSLLRLSSMTLPHAMARLILAEQLYRAASLIKGHPYHRE